MCLASGEIGRGGKGAEGVCVLGAVGYGANIGC